MSSSTATARTAPTMENNVVNVVVNISTPTFLASGALLAAPLPL
ncbi:hypothetical protein [Saccharopolyspora oryzae]|uniref:Uncharacterized protein n=1 Tax=Saccharopolyspora oryzae TaxID=2997343 RepID=A0ABT4V944_9PSEU|nr:hypothetical protein [Saccharopolyspora oryzae]MDA3630475.1 hypothetical protein [Saccharopolyspora oryzae]